MRKVWGAVSMGFFDKILNLKKGQFNHVREKAKEHKESAVNRNENCEKLFEYNEKINELLNKK